MKGLLGLVLALSVAAFSGAPAHAQCYPGLACPTDQKPEPQPTPKPMPEPTSRPTPSDSASQQGAKRGEYHFVGPVSPPDDWLSLRTLPSDKSGARVMKMPAGTPFLVREKRDQWWFVELRDGTTGWAHSKWIRCCKSGNE